jgi:hypothetical protein
MSGIQVFATLTEALRVGFHPWDRPSMLVRIKTAHGIAMALVKSWT